MAQHARLSASAAHRWMLCPASIKRSEGIPDKGSPYAQLGTMAHSVAAYCLRKGLNADAILDEFAEEVQFYLDYVRSQWDGPLDRAAIEVDLTPALRRIDRDAGGMADFVRYRPTTRELLVTDLKFGSGVTVEAKGNKQLRVYALGALLTMGVHPETVRAVICQPRIDDKEHRIKEDAFSAIELLDFAGDISLAAAQSRLDNPPVVGGEEQCRWCPANRTCDQSVRYTPRKPVGAMAAAEDFPVVRESVI